MKLWLAIWTLAFREVVRFARQPSRVVAIIASPVLFWIVIGSGLGDSFQSPTAPPTMSYIEYFFPGTMVLIVLFATVFASISIIEDRREGFLQSVLVAPVPRSSIVLGKVLGITILALIQADIFLLLAPFAGISISLIAFVNITLLLFLVAFGLSSMGFAIAWQMDSTQGFHAIINLFLIPMWMLSGALFPPAGAAGWVATIMQFNPLTYGVSATRIVMYDFNADYSKGLPSLELSITVIILFCMMMLFFAVTVVLRRDRGVELGKVKSK